MDRKSLFTKFALPLLATLCFAACQNNTFSEAPSAGFGMGVLGGKTAAMTPIADPTVKVVGPRENCSGAYIGRNRVLTAAHCAFKAGVTRIAFVSEKGRFDCFAVSRAAHSKFISGIPDYDIAVLKFTCDAAVNLEKIHPFELATASTLEPLMGAGYGMTGPSESDDYHLRFMPLERFNMTSALSDQRIPSRQKNKDGLAQRAQSQKDGIIQCFKASSSHSLYFGDSGGPSYAVNPKGLRTVYGIQSCLYLYNDSVTMEQYHLYAACQPTVSFFHDWIEAQF